MPEACGTSNTPNSTASSSLEAGREAAAVATHPLVHSSTNEEGGQREQWWWPPSIRDCHCYLSLFPASSSLLNSLLCFEIVQQSRQNQEDRKSRNGSLFLPVFMFLLALSCYLKTKWQNENSVARGQQDLDEGLWKGLMGWASLALIYFYKSVFSHCLLETSAGRFFISIKWLITNKQYNNKTKPSSQNTLQHKSSTGDPDACSVCEWERFDTPSQN